MTLGEGIGLGLWSLAFFGFLSVAVWRYTAGRDK